MRSGRSRLALVLGGGGSKGAMQAGLYRALCQLGIRPDLIVGASVGALNGAAIAAGVGPKTLAHGWESLSRRDLLRFNRRILWRLGAVRSIFSSNRFYRFLEGRLPVRTFSELKIPLMVITTRLATGEARVWERGDLPKAVQASCSIPGILPPVKDHEGIWHVDGALADNLPVETAGERGATHIIAMNCRTCARCAPEPDSLSDVIGLAFGIAIDCKLRAMEQRYRDDPTVLLLQPDIGERIYALDFSHGRRLVEAGYEYSLPRIRAWWERTFPAGSLLPRGSTVEVSSR